MSAIPYLAFTGLGFLSGAVMYSYLIPGALKGVDVVEASPDGNAGVWNAASQAGKGVGALCLLLDLAKGFAPVFIAWHVVSHSSFLFIAVVVAPILGHIISPFSRKLSGKGITTLFGSLLGLMPMSSAAFGLLFCYGFFLIVIHVQPHELLSLYACGIFDAAMLVRLACGQALSLVLCCIAATLCVCVRAVQTMPDEPHTYTLMRRKPLERGSRA